MWRRVGEQLGTLTDVFRNPQLRRLELAWAGYYVGEWAHFVALSIYAFSAGGAAAVGLLGLVRMAPAAIALPIGGMLCDRYPRQRVLLGMYLLRATTLAAMALALAADSPHVLVFTLAGLTAIVGAPVRPATLALVPMLARTPHELVAANVSSSTLEGLGTFVGPAVGGVLAARAGPDVAVAAAAAVYIVCALLVGGIRREGDVARGRQRIERDTVGELLGGLRTLRREPQPRLIVLLFASQAMVRGLLNVLLVVAAIDLLDIGEAGVGWLNAVLGAGGLIGGLASVSLVRRRRLGGAFGIALVLWGAPISFIGLWPAAAWAMVCLAVVGIGNALLDVSGFTLLQRTVDEHVLGRVFGVFEIGVAAAVALGSVLGPIEISALGTRTALIVTGLLLPALAALTRAGMRSIDDASSVPERELELLSGVPLFAPLPVTTLERLASRVVDLEVPAGTALVEQGAPGDLFYLIAAGEIDVVRDGTLVRTLDPGDYFGEIALLHDVPRVASCIARTQAEVFTLDRERFVAAVGGDIRTSATAEDVISTRLSELAALATSGGVVEGANGEQAGEPEQDEP
jgi:predicted MFS family arabinose efflux permease